MISSDTITRHFTAVIAVIFFPEYVSIVWSSGATVKKGNIVSKGFELWHYYVIIGSTSRELGKVGHNQ